MIVFAYELTERKMYRGSMYNVKVGVWFKARSLDPLSMECPAVDFVFAATMLDGTFLNSYTKL